MSARANSLTRWTRARSSASVTRYRDWSFEASFCNMPASAPIRAWRSRMAFWSVAVPIAWISCWRPTNRWLVLASAWRAMPSSAAAAGIEEVALRGGQLRELAIRKYGVVANELLHLALECAVSATGVVQRGGQFRPITGQVIAGRVAKEIFHAAAAAHRL